MPRINIEDSLFKDIRYMNLCIKLGNADQALGVMVRAFALAQKWCLTPDRKIPLTEWKNQGLPDAIFHVGLAEIHDGKVYVSGSEEQFKWLKQRSNAGKIGGRVASQAKLEIIKKSSKRPLSEAIEVNPLPLPLPLPHTLNIKNIAQQVERVYRDLYPRKIGKAKGMQRLAREITTDDDLAKFEIAVKNYLADIRRNKVEDRFIKHFSSFTNEWRDWIDIKPKTTFVEIKPE